MKLFLDTSTVSFEIDLSTSAAVTESDSDTYHEHRYIASLTTLNEARMAKWELAFSREAERDWFVSKVDKVLQKRSSGEVCWANNHVYFFLNFLI
jgi:hypothetical protein